MEPNISQAGRARPRDVIVGRNTLRWFYLTVLHPLFLTAVLYGAEPVISEVALQESAINPTAGKATTLSFKLSKSEAVTVMIFDPDGELIRELRKETAMDSGDHQLVWDGRDDSGQLVPDEAYTFTIETRSGEVYDPFATSGGTVGDIRDAELSAKSGTVVYTLPTPARVLIRLGIKSGPMLKTLVDWKPRVAGSITEYWDGRDEDRLVNLYEDKNFNALITYVALPATTVIAYGNETESYRDYKRGRGKERPKKPLRPRLANLDTNEKLAPEGFVPSPASRAPRVEVTFPNVSESKAGVPSVGAGVDVRIDVDSSDKEALLSQQFEIIFFVDNVFFAEAERGYLPYNWRWELQQLPPGEHILSVNISSFRGQVGVGSRKITVVKADGK